MKKVVFTFILSLLFLSLSAQDFEIVNIESLPADMSAREEMKTDHNDRQCALLRIATQNIAPNQREAFSFVPDLGSEVVERATRDGEIWLWVSPSLKYLRVKHRDWGQYELRMLDYVSRVESLHTYKISIKGTMAMALQEQNNNSPTQQYLVFQLSPTNAVLEVDGQLWEVAPDGSAMKYVNFGTYTYRVQAPNYLSETGNVTVDDPENTKTVNVRLKPDFVEVTLKVDADAEIWVNNEKKGIRTWTGALGKGTYKIECKQEGHETKVISKEITAAMNGQTITLPVPQPIYGSLNLESVPIGAAIYLDGKEVGKTPKSLNEIIIGQHEVKLVKDDYLVYVAHISIKESQRERINAILVQGKEINFSCNVINSLLYVDGVVMGDANGNYTLSLGQHIIRATAPDYNEYNASFFVTESAQFCSIHMDAISKTPSGALPGTFSVGANKRVYFSKGNLQYRASTGTWRFATNQYDFIGEDNKNIAEFYNDWIDLFSWGTSGYNHGAKTYQPWISRSYDWNHYAFGSSSKDLSDQADWGYNAISNGGNKTGQWRTLTGREWRYVFFDRLTNSGIRFVKAKVNNVDGVLLLPDDWEKDYFVLSGVNNDKVDYSVNVITASQWTTIEQYGAVFLPSAGSRNSSGGYFEIGGHYWSASAYYLDQAEQLVFYYNSLVIDGGGFSRGRSLGCSVRLVQNSNY